MIHCMPAKRTALQGFNEFIEQTKKSYVRFNFQVGVFFFVFVFLQKKKYPEHLNKDG